MSDIMEARRKGFEEFYLTQDNEAAAHLNFIRDDGEYGYHVTRLAWYCWNQALDSVCVELPGSFWPGESSSPCIEVPDIVEAIERAGLKVKP